MIACADERKHIFELNFVLTKKKRKGRKSYLFYFIHKINEERIINLDNGAINFQIWRLAFTSV